MALYVDSGYFEPTTPGGGYVVALYPPSGSGRASRIIFVRAEPRTITIQPELRTIGVPREDRTIVVTKPTRTVTI